MKIDEEGSQERLMSKFDLSVHGLNVQTILRNADPSQLYEEAIRYEPGTRISNSGALIAYSGEKTGRSPQDKRLVKNSSPALRESPKAARTRWSEQW